jgi:hypothetical protein
MAWLLTAALIALPLAGLAAISLTFVDRAQGPGNLTTTFYDLDLDTSYRNGGESLTPAQLGLSSVVEVTATCDNSGYLLQYDYSAEKLIVFGVLDSLHAALYGPLVDIAPDSNAVDLSGVTGIMVRATGR